MDILPISNAYFSITRINRIRVFDGSETAYIFQDIYLFDACHVVTLCPPTDQILIDDSSKILL